ncbi:unnamed protein product [Closterium sp. NIES-53]
MLLLGDTDQSTWLQQRGLVLGGRRPVVLTCHADASWADDLATQRSSQGYTFSLGSGSVSWRSTRSSSVLGSSCEAEIYAGAMAAQEFRWLTYLLTDLGEPPRSPPVLYQRGQLRLAYVASEANTAYIFTKALPPGDHQRFCTMLACFALLDWSCDLLFSPTLPMGCPTCRTPPVSRTHSTRYLLPTTCYPLPAAPPPPLSPPRTHAHGRTHALAAVRMPPRSLPATCAACKHTRSQPYARPPPATCYPQPAARDVRPACYPLPLAPSRSHTQAQQQHARTRQCAHALQMCTHGSARASAACTHNNRARNNKPSHTRLPPARPQS